MPRLIVRPEAQQDIHEAAAWYEARRPGLGAEFVAEIRRYLLNIQDNPKQYPTVYRRFRRATLSRFPYLIFYTIEDGSPIVAAVVHGSRRPGVWRRRHP